jgi:hypothetical protein
MNGNHTITSLSKVDSLSALIAVLHTHTYSRIRDVAAHMAPSNTSSAPPNGTARFPTAARIESTFSLFLKFRREFATACHDRAVTTLFETFGDDLIVLDPEHAVDDDFFALQYRSLRALRSSRPTILLSVTDSHHRLLSLALTFSVTTTPPSCRHTYSEPATPLLTWR